LFNGRVAIFGFASTWTTDNLIPGGEVDGKKVAWQLAPQIWLHANRSIAIGTKLDYSRNMYTKDGSNDFLPTVGLRWVY